MQAYAMPVLQLATKCSETGLLLTKTRFRLFSQRYRVPRFEAYMYHEGEQR